MCDSENLKNGVTDNKSVYNKKSSTPNSVKTPGGRRLFIIMVI